MKVYYNSATNTIVLGDVAQFFPKGALIASNVGNKVSVMYTNQNLNLAVYDYSDYKKQDGSPAGANATAVVAYLNTEFAKSETISGLVPIGSVQGWFFSTIPAEYLELNGQIVSYSSYPVLGALFGVSSGVFTLPDLRGVALYGDSVALQDIGTDTVDLTHNHSVSLTTSSNGSHNHGGKTGAPSATTPYSLLVGLVNEPTNTHTHTISSDGAHTHTVTGNTGNVLSVIDKRPRRKTIKWIIRAI